MEMKEEGEAGERSERSSAVNEEGAERRKKGKWSKL